MKLCSIEGCNRICRVRGYCNRHYNKIFHGEAFRAMTKRYSRKKRQELLDFLGGKCVRCGFTDYRALQIDHINGGGGIHLKSIGYSQSKLGQDVRAFPEKYQLLCANCNWIKRDEEGETGRPRKY
jgi:hypothetical protein